MAACPRDLIHSVLESPSLEHHFFLLSYHVSTPYPCGALWCRPPPGALASTHQIPARERYCDREALGPSAYLRGCAPASPTTHHFLCGFHSIRAPRTVPLCTHAIRIAQPAGGDQGGSMRYSGHRCSSCPRRGLAERSSRPRAPRPDHMPPHPSAFAWHPYTSSTPPVHLQGSGATAAVGRRWVARGTMRIRTQPLDPPTPRSHYLSRAPCVRSWGDARRARPSATRALNRTRARVLCRVTARHSDAGKSGGAL